MTEPRYFLFTATSDDPAGTGGRWQILLQSLDGDHIFQASDDEPAISGERLELLSVVRGLEAVAEPSQVTLLCSSERVVRAIRSSMDVWRANQWQWERFGRMEPIKNQDLWLRIDRALNIHRVTTRTVRVNPWLAGDRTVEPAADRCEADAGRYRPIEAAAPEAAARRRPVGVRRPTRPLAARTRLRRTAATSRFEPRWQWEYWQTLADRLLGKSVRSLVS